MATNGVAVPISETVIADVQDDVMEDPMSPGAIDEAAEGKDELEDAAADLDLGDEDSEGSNLDEEDDGDENGEDEEDAEAGEDEEGGAPVSPSAVPMIGTDIKSASIPSLSLQDEAVTNNPSLNPTRPTPYVHDAGHLMIIDPNPVPTSASDPVPTEAMLTANARDAAQSLLNHLLTTCPITSSKNSTSGSGVNMNLPQPAFALPREKRVPTPKAPTKWEQFAAKKGIGKNKRKGQEGEDRAGKMVYDEASGEWIPKYGYKGKNKQGENDWLVEVDEKEERGKAQAGEAGKDPRNMSRGEKREKIRRNERKMRANERKGAKLR